MLHSVRIALIHWVTSPNSTRANNYISDFEVFAIHSLVYRLSYFEKLSV